MTPILQTLYSAAVLLASLAHQTNQDVLVQVHENSCLHSAIVTTLPEDEAHRRYGITDIPLDEFEYQPIPNTDLAVVLTTYCHPVPRK